MLITDDEEPHAKLCDFGVSPSSALGQRVDTPQQGLVPDTRAALWSAPEMLRGMRYSHKVVRNTTRRFFRGR